MTQPGPRRLSLVRLIGLTLFALAFGVGANTLEPALLGFRVLQLAPDQKNTVLGALTAAGLLVAVATQPLVGALSDRTRSPLGRRIPYFAIGTALAVASLYALAQAPALALLALTVMSYQAGSNTAQGPWQALLPDQVPASQRGMASGLKSLFEILGFTVGRRLSGYLIARGEVTLAVTAVSVTFAAGLGLTAVAAWASRHGSDPRPAPPSGIRLQELRGLLSRRGFHWWFINRSLFWSAVIALNTFILFYLMDVVGMAFEEASRLFGDLSLTLGLGVLIMSIPAGRLADRVGRRPIVIASGLVAAAGTSLLLVVRSQGGLIVIGALLGAAVGTWLSANWALLTDLVPSARPALYLGIANIATAGGSLVSRFAGALLIDPINSITQSRASGYLSLYALAVLAFLLATWAASRVRPTQPRSSVEGDPGLGV